MRYLFITLICCFYFHINLSAATLAVLPGESIQAQIDASSAGDIVAIFGGTYAENITINKAIRLVEVSGQDVILLGGVTFDGVTDAPPFEGFTVGSSGKDITIRDTTGLLLRTIDHSAGSTVVISGSSDNTKIVECTLANFDPDAGVMELVDSTVNSTIQQSGGKLHTSNVTVGGNFNTGDSTVYTIAFRTTVNSDCNWYGNRSWFGYSAAQSFNFYGSNAKVVVVGSTIDRGNSEADGIRLHGSLNQFTITNSMVVNVRSYYTGDENCIDVRGSNSAIIINNYLQKTHTDYHSNNDGNHDVIYVLDTDSVTIANNICVQSYSGLDDGFVRAPFGTTISNNLANGPNGVNNGATATATISGDPLFVDGDPYQLGEGSPCINAGTEDPRYNDRDGSRNDIGPSGGAWYDPDGWTTENPVVIAFELSVDQILEGEATPVLLQEGLGVSIP